MFRLLNFGDPGRPSRDNSKLDARLLRRRLLHDAYNELPIISVHAVGTGSLRLIHKYPFTRGRCVPDHHFLGQRRRASSSLQAGQPVDCLPNWSRCSSRLCVLLYCVDQRDLPTHLSRVPPLEWVM